MGTTDRRAPVAPADGGALVDGRAPADSDEPPTTPDARPSGATTTFLVIVHARLTADDVAPRDMPALAARVADTFISRDDAATVWIHLGARSSRITLDVPAADRAAAIARAAAIVAEVTAGLGVACRVVATAATTERERTALPVECPADGVPATG